MMFRARFGFGLLLLGSLLGCDGTSATDDASDSDIVVSNGEKFISEVQSDGTVVLFKSVAGSSLSYTPAGMRNKTLLIHPLKGVTDTGVLGHIVDVQDGGDTWLVKTEALALDEVMALDVDRPNVIALHVDRSLLLSPSSAPPSLAGLDFGLKPLTIPPSLVNGDLPVQGFIPFSDTTGAVGAITIHQDSGALSVTPQGKLQWQKGRGLEVGFKLDFDLESQTSFSGVVLGIPASLSSPEISTPPVLVAVPIGGVPVPVMVSLVATLSCSVSAGVKFQGAVNLSAHASLGGSRFIHPSRNTPVEQWVTQGEWPDVATGTASLTKTGDLTFAPTAAITCIVPRIGLETKIVDVAGPYVAVKNMVSLSDSGLTFTAKLVAGARIGIGSRSIATEVTVAAFSP
jgi:hypothetical protein